MTKTKTDPLERYIRHAAERLVNSWSALTHAEARAAVEDGALDDADLDVFCCPAWGTVFKVTGCDARNVSKLLVPLTPDDEESALALVAETGMGTNVEQFYTCDECDSAPSGFVPSVHDDDRKSKCCNADVTLTDERGLVDAVLDDWREGNYEDESFASCGWQGVKGTGLLAYDLGGDELLLGSNSGGHDFYEAYWIPLYKLLGYTWHLSDYRQQKVHDATDALLKAYEQRDKLNPKSVSNLAPLIERLAVAKGRLSTGGPLSDEEKAELDAGEA